MTAYHAKYFAHKLTKRCSSDSDGKLVASLADAQVDLNPHQIDAAWFAFCSPLSFCLSSMSDSQQFLRDLEKLWTAADCLRANLGAAVYKHAVLGLIFLKYVSDSFATRQREIEAQLRDPNSDYYLDPNDGGSEEDYAEAIHHELEERDYYIEKNVFWVPALARWKTLQDSAKLPPGTEIEVNNGKKTTYKITSTGRLIDDALDAIGRENPKLNGDLHPAPARPGEPQQPHRPHRHHPLRARRPARQGHPRPRLRILPRPVRPRGGEKGRPVFQAEVHRLPHRRDARALPGARLRPRHGLRRLLCLQAGPPNPLRETGTRFCAKRCPEPGQTGALAAPVCRAGI